MESFLQPHFSQPMTRSLGLYIHWPFCVSKCPYCDFNSFVGKSIDVALYEKAYVMELDRVFENTSNHHLQTIFFGGGTPSLMPPALTEKIIQKAKNLWQHNDDLEITLEANPSTAEINRFQNFKNAGINRLSIGIQSFEQESLAFLGRNHNAKEGIAAIELAQKIFDRVSFDLIYARPNQTLEAWEDELSFAFQLGTSHLSLYQLTIEPGTAFAPRYDRGEIVLPDEELSADLYLATLDMTETANLPYYEVSNFSRSGLESQHNLIYWRYKDYVGIGPGAHGRYYKAKDKIATEQHRAPDIWLKAALEKRNGDHRVTLISKKEQERERLMMGLRLREGMTYDDNTFLDKNRLNLLEGQGDIILQDNHMALTTNGMLRLNGILRYLLQ